MNKNNYLPIKLQLLVNESILIFDIYYFNKDKEEFILYHSKNSIFSEEQRKSIKEFKRKIYIKNDSIFNYLNYLNDNLGATIANYEIKFNYKIKFYYHSALEIVKVIYNNPESKTNMAVSYELARNTVDLVLDSEMKFKSLLEIIVNNNENYTHSINTALLSVNFGKRLGLNYEALEELSIGAMLHDIGKTKLEPELLEKDIEERTEIENERFREHVNYGFDIVKQYGDLPGNSKDIILNHHENFNGTGYPFKLKGKEISLLTQITTISDVFDSLSSKNNTNKSFDTFNIMKNNMSGSFNDELLISYIKMFSATYY
jgi:putative nucleotidyltransferase with HDIG domain